MVQNELMLAVNCLLALSAVGAGWNAPRSAEFCGDCHRTNYARWSISKHARAMDSRLFQDAMHWTEIDAGTEASQTCLGCHAPLAEAGEDPDLQKKVTWEGVTCDYCHSVREVSMTGPNPKAKLKFSPAKAGPPWMQPDPRRHGAVSVEVFTNSEFCALCHQYQNKLGFPVLTTFSEWKASRYAKEGRQCQSCHMSELSHRDLSKHLVTNPMNGERHNHCEMCHAAHLAEGVKMPGQTNQPGSDRIGWHGLEGASSAERLTNAISAQLAPVREGDKLRVNVEVANTAAGHYLPSGSPMRQLILEVQADTDSGQHFSGERVYRRIVADQQSKLFEREYMAFVRGDKNLEDTRLAPDEKRSETFLFDVPKGVGIQVKATLCYFYSPFSTTNFQQRVEFLSLKSRVR